MRKRHGVWKLYASTDSSSDAPLKWDWREASRSRIQRRKLAEAVHTLTNGEGVDVIVGSCRAANYFRHLEALSDRGGPQLIVMWNYGGAKSEDALAGSCTKACCRLWDAASPRDRFDKKEKPPRYVAFAFRRTCPLSLAREDSPVIDRVYPLLESSLVRCAHSGGGERQRRQEVLDLADSGCPKSRGIIRDVSADRSHHDKVTLLFE